MGYTTDFSGSFTCTPELTAAQVHGGAGDGRIIFTIDNFKLEAHTLSIPLRSGVNQMNDNIFADALDLLNYSEDHLKELRVVLSPSMDGGEIDQATALLSYASRRIEQLGALLFNAGVSRS